MAFLTPAALAAMGFASLGEDVCISDKASIYGTERIEIGSHVRIDDFCVISAGVGGIKIGSYIHIAPAANIVGAASITFDDFSGLSGRVSVYSSSDDYSGATLTNPTVPDEFKSVRSRPVHIGRHVIVGCGAVILPGTHLREGCAVNALSLVAGQWPPFTIVGGVPATRLKDRKQDLLELERQFLAGLQA